MIAATLRHKQELLNILAKYPYTFYAYGSRTKGTQQEFSDLDICYFEHIPSQALDLLKNDLEESNLPFIVQLTNWQKASTDFRQLIHSDLVPIQASPFLKQIETNLWEQLCYPIKRLGLEISGSPEVRITNSFLNTPILNVVCATNTTEEKFDQIFNQTVIPQFNNKTFSWWIGPSSQPTTIESYLINRGFSPKVREEAMCLPLTPFEPIANLIQSQSPPDAPHCQFITVSSTRKFIDFAIIYQYVDPDGIGMIGAEPRNQPTSEKNHLSLFVGYTNKYPAVIGSLFFANGVAGICNLACREEDSKTFVRQQMLGHLLEYAQKKGATHAMILSANQENTDIYSYLGFKTIGFFDHYQAPDHLTPAQPKSP